ncbi:MAG: hypothetical protein PHW01_00295 [Patescibacteria group bacterium]|nr:hypothetical protein [Patescibacteria group bacterium]
MEIKQEKFTDLYNQTGVPFQYKTLELIKELTNFQATLEFPFTYPTTKGPQLGQSSAIDIIALREKIKKTVFDFGGLVLFFIECKRADPENKIWLFSAPQDNCSVSPSFFLKIIKKTNEFLKLEPNIQRVGSFPGLGYSSAADLNYCLQCVEFRDDLKDINKNKTKTVYTPLLQANHAMSAFFNQEEYYPPKIEGIEFLEIKNGKLISEISEQILFVPVVVTTADLFVTKYNPIKVSDNDGKINPSNIKFDGPKKWITYEFPLPDYLKSYKDFIYDISPTSGNTLIKRGPLKLEVERSTTFIVNSNHWQEFLKNFSFQI